MTKVKLPDNSCSNYTYDNLGRLISVRYTNEDGSEIKYGSLYSLTYNTNNQITNITEKSAENTIGNYLNFEYKSDNTTKVTDRNGSSETYTFDTDGTKVSTMNANGYISNNQSSELTVSKSEDNYIKNYLNETSDFSGIKNSDGYYYSESSNPDNKYSLDTDTKYFGTNAIKIYNKDKQDKDSVIYHNISQKSLLGKYVTFSAYVKTTCENNGAGKVNLAIQYKDNSEEKTIDGFVVSDEVNWKRISVTAKLPSTATDVKVLLKSNGKDYTTWFDCLQLEEGETVNDYNALINSDFASADNWFDNGNNKFTFTYGRPYIFGKPSYVNTDNSSDTVTTITDDKTENSDSTDNKNQLGNSFIYQRVNVNAKNVSFTLSGQAQGNSVPLSNENRTFGIALNVYYEGEKTPESHYQSFNSNTTSVQSVSLSVTPENSDKVVSCVDYAFVYGYNDNTMIPSNAMLKIMVSPGTTSTDSASSSSGDDNTQGTTSASSEVEYGDMISEELDTSEPYLQSNSTFDSNGNYVTEETDDNGITNKYAYDANGNKSSITNGNNVKTSYTYDSSDNATSITTDGTSNKYDYDYQGNVESISHNNFSFKFNYNEYNKLLSTYVGDSQIVSNTYSPYNGNLLKVSYANGSVISYTYDEYNNVTNIKCNDNIVAEYTYNKNGQISICEDSESGETTYYYYDSNGNLESQFSTGKNSNLASSITTDENGNTVEKTEIDNNTRTITSGTDSDGKSFVGYNGLKTTEEKDEFGRVTSISTKSKHSLNVVNKYIGDENFDDEDNVNSNSTDTLSSRNINKQRVLFDGRVVSKYEYEYDNNGNITSIKQDGKEAHRYKYDKKNQLTEEYDYVNNYYINYSLDGNGNIHSVNTQALDTDGLPTGSPHGNIYYYGDTEWCDKLTGVNGVDNITYDEIGNPLNYRDGMSFTWKNGRWLSTTTLSDGTKITYRYNANGMRTQKKVGSNVTDYYYDSNNNLIAEKTDSATLFFYYDTENSPIALSYNGKMFYYVKNLQGDIVKILDEDGISYASYVYDSWGNILEEKGEPILRKLNPLRYRGYVYDEDTTLYYLQTRYYDPTTGRFINADNTVFIGSSGTAIGDNIYTYCENNPVNRSDRQGTYFKELYDKLKKGLRKLTHGVNNILVKMKVDTAKLGSIALQMKKDKYGVYHASFNCWQQLAGYNDFYDFAFDLGTSMKRNKCTFTCSANKKDYVFWGWKGDYINLGAGAELGFYRKVKHTRLYVVDKNFTFKMSMKLYYKNKCIINYRPDQLQWWITGFNPKYQNININKLRAKFTVSFKNHKNIFRSFYNKYKKRKDKKKNNDWKYWRINAKKYKGYLSF